MSALPSMNLKRIKVGFLISEKLIDAYTVDKVTKNLFLKIFVHKRWFIKFWRMWTNENSCSTADRSTKIPPF